MARSRFLARASETRLLSLSLFLGAGIGLEGTGAAVIGGFGTGAVSSKGAGSVNPVTGAGATTGSLDFTSALGGDFLADGFTFSTLVFVGALEKSSVEVAAVAIVSVGSSSSIMVSSLKWL